MCGCVVDVGAAINRQTDRHKQTIGANDEEEEKEEENEEEVQKIVSRMKGASLPPSTQYFSV
jgi:hypothetical protein